MQAVVVYAQVSAFPPTDSMVETEILRSHRLQNSVWVWMHHDHGVGTRSGDIAVP